MRMISNAFRQCQLLRFLLVGSFNTAFSYGVYAVMLFVGLNFAAANFVALVLGILVSFKTQGSLVFRNNNNRLLGRFVVGWAVIYLASIALIGQIIAIGLNAYIAGALALPFTTMLSYFLQKYFVFPTPTTLPANQAERNRKKST